MPLIFLRPIAAIPRLPVAMCLPRCTPLLREDAQDFNRDAVVIINRFIASRSCSQNFEMDVAETTAVVANPASIGRRRDDEEVIWRFSLGLRQFFL